MKQFFEMGGGTCRNNLDLSIIIPVYNVEKYLKECLNSISKIKDINYEIIIVNDGSLDNSQKIIEEFCKKNNRARFFIKENGGQSSARNYGLKRAEGEYIWFVDSDDFINPNEFQNFYLEFKKYDLDIGYFNFLTFDDEDDDRLYRKNEDRQLKKKNIIFGKEYFNNILEKTLRDNIVWNKLYKKKFIDENNILFEEGIIFEDILYNIFSIIKARKIKYFNFYSYVFRGNREGSTTTNLDKEKAKNSCKRIVEIYINNFEELKGIKVIENKMIDLYFNYLDCGGKREKNIENIFFKLNQKELTKCLKYKIKLFKRTYIEKKYKF